MRITDDDRNRIAKKYSRATLRITEADRAKIAEVGRHRTEERKRREAEEAAKQTVIERYQPLVNDVKQYEQALVDREKERIGSGALFSAAVRQNQKTSAALFGGQKEQGNDTAALVRDPLTGMRGEDLFQEKVKALILPQLEAKRREQDPFYDVSTMELRQTIPAKQEAELAKYETVAAENEMPQKIRLDKPVGLEATKLAYQAGKTPADPAKGIVPLEYNDAYGFTDEEWNTLSYWYAVDESKADEYFRLLRDTRGKRRAEEANELEAGRIYRSIQERGWLGRTLGSAGLALAGGAADTLDSLKNYDRTKYGEATVPTNPMTSANRMNVEKIAEDSALLGTVLEVGTLVGSMIPAWAAGSLNPALGTVTLFAQSTGSAASTALEEGASLQEANTYGFLVGSLETLLSGFLGGVGKLSFVKNAAGGLTKLISGVAKKVITNPTAMKIVKGGAQLLSRMGAEGFEEYLQSIAEPVVANIVYDAGKDVSLWGEDQWVAALLGALTAGVIEGPRVAIGGRAKVVSNGIDEGTAIPQTTELEAPLQEESVATMPERSEPATRQADLTPELSERIAKTRSAGGGFIRNAKTPKAFTQKDARIVSGLAKSQGLVVRFGETGPYSRGYIDGDVIVLNPESEDPVLDTFAHEVAHYLEKSAAGEYVAYSDAVMEILYDETLEGETRAKVLELKELYEEYAGQTLDAHGVQSELAAEFAAWVLEQNPGVLEQLAKKHYTPMQKISAALRSVWQTFQSWVTNKEKKDAQISPTAARQFMGIDMRSVKTEQIETALMYLQRALETNAANVAAGKTAVAANENGTPQMRILNVPGTELQYVQADRQVIHGKDKNKWGGQVETYINETIRSGKDVVFPTPDGDFIAITADTAWKMRDRHQGKIGKKTEYLSKADYRVKSVAAVHVDELLQVSKFKNSRDPNEDRAGKVGEDGFDYRTILFRDFNGQMYELTISVGINGDQKTAYNIGKIKKQKNPTPNFVVGSELETQTKAPNGSKQNSLQPPAVSGARNDRQQQHPVGEDSSDSSIAQTPPAVNTQDMQNGEKNASVQHSLDRRKLLEEKRAEADARREERIARKIEAAENRVYESAKEFAGNFARFLGVTRRIPRLEAKGKEIVDAIRENKLTSELKETLFAEVYRIGLQESVKEADSLKELKQEIRQHRFYVSEQTRKGITDYSEFVKRYSGRLLVKHAAEGEFAYIDSTYEALREKYGELLPEATDQAEMLQNMAEVWDRSERLQAQELAYLEDESPELEEASRIQYRDGLELMKEGVAAVARYQADLKDQRKELAEAVRMRQEAESSIPDVMEATKQMSKLTRKFDKICRDGMLTREDKEIVDQLAKDKISEMSIPQDVSRKAHKTILQAAELKKQIDACKETIVKLRQEKVVANRQFAKALIGDLADWKNPGAGWKLNRETAERIIKKANKKNAEMIVDLLVTPVHENEAEATRMRNAYKKRVADLKLDEVEAFAVQFLGEFRAREAELAETEKRGKLGKTEARELQMIREDIRKVETELGTKQLEKINGAIQTFREIYDEIMQMINMAEIRNGQMPTLYRKGYFPHFKNDQQKGLFLALSAGALPTTIAGMTHEFSPTKRWVGNLKQRTGTQTEYDAVKGFEQYIDSVSDYIWHMDDISRLRAFEMEMRYQFSDKGTQEEADRIANENPEESQEEKQTKLKELYDRNPSEMGTLVTWMHEYVNMLAGKKHISDRAAEYELGRGIYRAVNIANRRLGANMVGANISSALTNFIPLTQATAVIRNPLDLVHGACATLMNWKYPDGLNEASTFLTNRRGTETLVATKGEKAAGMAGKLFEMIDRFTAGTIVRAAYYNEMRRIGKGGNVMSDAGQQAIKYADRLAADVMGDRSKGAAPMLFTRSSPIVKAMTAFQLEVNNQASFFMKDIARYAKLHGGNKKEIAEKIILGLTEAFLFAWSYNYLTEKLTGRKAAFSPVDLVIDGGKEIKEAGWGPGLKNMADALLGELPFIGGGFGAIADSVFGTELSGGRFPLDSAVPNFQRIKSVLEDENDKLSWLESAGTMAWELAAPVLYLALPFGGGQIKKTVEGTAANLRGGSYLYNRKGEQLRFPVEPNVGTMLQGAVFGQYALPAAEDYVDSDFRVLPPLETEMYHYLRGKLGETEAYDVIQELRAIEGDEEQTAREKQQQWLFDNDQLTAKQKAYLDEFWISARTENGWRDYSSEQSYILSGLSEAAQKRYQRFEKIVSGIDAEDYAKLVSEIPKIRNQTEGGKVVKTAKEQKLELLQEKFGCTKAEAEALLAAWNEPQ